MKVRNIFQHCNMVGVQRNVSADPLPSHRSSIVTSLHGRKRALKLTYVSGVSNSTENDNGNNICTLVLN